MDITDPNLTLFMKRNPPKEGATILVGSRDYGGGDRRTLYGPGSPVLGIDQFEGPGVDLVHDFEKPLTTLHRFVHIDCCSVLEHCRRPWLMCKNMEDALQPDGTIMVSVPMVWRIHNFPDDYWRFTPNGLRSLFTEIDWVEIVIMARGKIFDRPFAFEDEKGRKFLERCEVFAFGRKL